MGNPVRVRYEENLPNSHTPYITRQATIWLDRFLDKNMTVFEFGSGGSTIFMAQRVKHIYVVEHDQNWTNKTFADLKKYHVGAKVDFIHCGPQPSESNEPEMYFSDYFPVPGMSFQNYARIIETVNTQFDLVFVDGMSRIGCIFHSIDKIKPGGALLLDNADEERHWNAEKMMSGFDYIDIYNTNGMVPHIPYCTAIWTKKTE